NRSSLIARDYAGFRSDRGQHLVLPASVSVPLIVKLEDSPVRPPEFAMGVRAPAPHRAVPAGDRAGAQGGRPAGALRRRVAIRRRAGVIPGVRSLLELEPGGGRGRV